MYDTIDSQVTDGYLSIINALLLQVRDSCPHLHFLTCTCVGIHPGRVAPAPPIELTMSPGSTALRELTRYFQLVTVGRLAQRSSFRHERGGVGRSMSLISSPSGRLVACLNQRSLLCRYTCKEEATPQFHGWHAISAPNV